MTLRRLWRMVQARRVEQWNHTAGLMALTANVHRGKRQRAFSADEFHPIKERPQPAKAKAIGITWGTFERMLGLDDE